MAVAVIRAGGIIPRRYFAGMTAARTKRSLAWSVVDKYQALPLAYHRSRPTGELMAHAEADVLAAVDILHPLPYSIAVVLLILFAGITLIVTDPFMALVGCSILPGLAFINRIYTRKVEGPATRAQERIGDVSSVAHESLDGALVVKTLGREQSRGGPAGARGERPARRADPHGLAAGLVRTLLRGHPGPGDRAPHSGGVLARLPRLDLRR